MIDRSTVEREAGRLLDSLDAGSDRTPFAGWVRELSALAEGDWTADEWHLAVTLLLLDDTTDGRFLPTPAQFRVWLRHAREEREREEQRRLLPAPAPAPTMPPTPPTTGTMKGPGSTFFARNVAIGKARVRKRFTLIGEWRYREQCPDGHVPREVWHGLDEPNEGEIDSELAEAGRIGARWAAKASEAVSS